jgi:hypothetical protein
MISHPFTFPFRRTGDSETKFILSANQFSSSCENKAAAASGSACRRLAANRFRNYGSFEVIEKSHKVVSVSLSLRR